MSDNASFPNTRMRRSRAASWSRKMVSETTLSPADLIWPLFITEGEAVEEPIAALPGVSRWSVDNIVARAGDAIALGIPCIALFPNTQADRRSDDGAEALNPENLMCRAIRAIKAAHGDAIGVLTDVALDPYTAHGQDGLIDESGYVLNDETVAVLVDQAVNQADAGADIIAPSDMMDGRIGAIRKALEMNGHSNVQIMSYAAKYASAFYGPFRDAVGSRGLLKGDKKGYQMDPANSDEALREVAMDIAEGADSVMVKPGLPYLDIIRRVKDRFEIPVFAYQVSGEYAMIEAAAAAGAGDRDALVLETLTAFKRAGCSGILTYHAAHAARLLRAQSMTAGTTGNSRALFLITILTGSFLLFLVQPMIARMALPRLGGAPAVWNSAMLVYQALLLAGYAYAHRLTQTSPRRQAIIHIILFAVAILWLPIGLANLQPPADGSPIFWVPWLLIASIGPLFFVVAAQAPLMQRWYSMSGNQGEPYALYAASNIGSFGGLIAYPILVEPFTTLQSQKWIWSGIYLALMALVGICAIQIWRTAGANTTPTEAAANEAPIGWRRRLYWIILAAVPSGLMLSTTSHLTTDLMAMPLIWVIPLGIYLLSFSVAFADNQKPAYWISRFAPIVLIVSAAFVFVVWGKAAIGGLTASLSLLFIVAVALHNEMYRTRPAPAQLTSFYLMMSVGGVLGGFFCAIVAPLLFDWTWEHPILILMAAALLPAIPLLRLNENDKRLPLIMVVIGMIALALGLFGGISEPVESSFTKILLAATIMTLGIAVAGFRIPFLLAVAGLLTINGGWYSVQQSLDGVRMRSYFGTYTVNASESGRVRWLNHGTTMHGMQLLDDPTRPISYYPDTSGVGIAMLNAPRLYGPEASIGVVGLGTGTLACYRRPGQYWQFFEIDPLVIEIARERKIFSFLEKCAPDVPITLGDARLTLAAVPEGKFDILALDAFSSDSIPLHLLTKEAFATYRKALKPDGILLVHISNRYIDLNPVVAAEAKANGWSAALRHDSPTEQLINRGNRASQWIALSRDPAKLAELTGKVDKVKSRYYNSEQWLQLDAPGKTSPWTDDYASVLPHLSLWKTL